MNICGSILLNGLLSKTRGGKMKDLLKIKQMEKEVPFRLSWILKDLLDGFGTSVDQSFSYLDRIIVSLVLFSLGGRAYNPWRKICCQ